MHGERQDDVEAGLGERVELPFGNGAAVSCLGARVEVVKNLADSDSQVCGPSGLLGGRAHDTPFSNWLIQLDRIIMKVSKGENCEHTA